MRSFAEENKQRLDELTEKRRLGTLNPEEYKELCVRVWIDRGAEKYVINELSTSREPLPIDRLFLRAKPFLEMVRVGGVTTTTIMGKSGQCLCCGKDVYHYEKPISIYKDVYGAPNAPTHTDGIYLTSSDRSAIRHLDHWFMDICSQCLSSFHKSLGILMRHKTDKSVIIPVLKNIINIINEYAVEAEI